MSSKYVAVAPRSGCPIANVLDLVGDRWSLLVLRDALLFDRHEFKEFLNAGEGVATNILAARLKRLTEVGLLEVAPHPTNKVKRLYFATDRAKALLPMLTEMVLWAADHAAGVTIPPEALALIRRDRSAFIAGSLARLTAWERENLSA